MAKGNDIAVMEGKLAKEALKNIQEEVASENISMIKDYVKGIYRFKRDLEGQVEKLEGEIAKIEEVLSKVSGGDVKVANSIKVPAKYLDEKTVRMLDMDWEE